MISIKGELYAYNSGAPSIRKYMGTETITFGEASGDWNGHPMPYTYTATFDEGGADYNFYASQMMNIDRNTNVCTWFKRARDDFELAEPITLEMRFPDNNTATFSQQGLGRYNNAAITGIDIKFAINDSAGYVSPPLAAVDGCYYTLSHYYKENKWHIFFKWGNGSSNAGYKAEGDRWTLLPLTPFIPSDDIYENEIGESTEGGGIADVTREGEDIDIPPLPQLSATQTGFVKAYAPSLSQIRNLASYMWGASFDLDTLKKIINEPFQLILGLSIVPVTPPTTSDSLTLGNIDTGITMPAITQQFVTIDCGSLNVNEYFGAYLDYEPFTKVDLYLPYIGTHQISVDDVMGKTINVVYHIDVISGACIAYVKCNNSVLYNFIGQCSALLPLSGRDFASIFNGVISASTAIGSIVAGAAASNPSAMISGAIHASASIAQTLKPNYGKSGGLSGTAGMMGIQYPYITITWPNLCIPSRQNKFIGYPSFITVSLQDVTGFQVIESCKLEYMHCTDEEKTELMEILKEGVIF